MEFQSFKEVRTTMEDTHTAIEKEFGSIIIHFCHNVHAFGRGELHKSVSIDDIVINSSRLAG